MPDHPDEHHRRLSRRDLLLAGGCACVGAVVAGCSGRSASSAGRPAGPATRSPTATPTPAVNVSRGPAATHGDVSRFRSRPDLTPAVVRINRPARRTADGLIFLDSHAGIGQQGPMIVDDHGELVWFKPLSSGGDQAHRAFNLRVQQYAGEPVLTWFEGAVVDGHGQGDYVIADTAYREIRRVRAGNGYLGDLHEFLLTDQGTALFTAYATARTPVTLFTGEKVNGYYYGIVQEVDVATGKVLFQWRSDAHIDIDESEDGPNRQGIVDSVHLNSIAVDAAGQLIISARNTSCVYKVDRRTGEVIWRLGGRKSDFRFGDGAAFAFQHHVVPHPDGTYSVFDNESPKPGAVQSRGLVLAVDETARTATLKRSYTHHPRVLAGSLGSVQILGNGNVFVGWGIPPYFSEYAADGTPLFDGKIAGRDTKCYRSFRYPWTGSPADKPAIAVHRSGGKAIVSASWNGATGVARWRVLAGDHAGALHPIGSLPRSGFETVLSVPVAAAHYAVEALDQSGKVLGRSSVRPV